MKTKQEVLDQFYKEVELESFPDGNHSITQQIDFIDSPYFYDCKVNFTNETKNSGGDGYFTENYDYVKTDIHSFVIEVYEEDTLIKSIDVLAKLDKCVLCGADTPYSTNISVELRENYIEGAGQLCSECANKLNK